jgi:hypothetical protein
LIDILQHLADSNYTKKPNHDSQKAKQQQSERDDDT